MCKCQWDPNSLGPEPVQNSEISEIMGQPPGFHSMHTKNSHESDHSNMRRFELKGFGIVSVYCTKDHLPIVMTLGMVIPVQPGFRHTPYHPSS